MAGGLTVDAGGLTAGGLRRAGTEVHLVRR
jgi:hypothetical protein